MWLFAVKLRRAEWGDLVTVFEIDSSGNVTTAGEVLLPGDPTDDLAAAPKQYVDAAEAAAEAASVPLAGTGDSPITGAVVWDSASASWQEAGDVVPRMTISEAGYITMSNDGETAQLASGEWNLWMDDSEPTSTAPGLMIKGRVGTGGVYYSLLTLLDHNGADILYINNAGGLYISDNISSINGVFGTPPLIIGRSSVAGNGVTLNLGNLAVPGTVTPSLVDETSSLTVGTAYYYKVAARRQDGTATIAGSEVTATPTSGNPAIQLSWAHVPGAAYYDVYRSTTSGTYGTDSLIGAYSVPFATTVSDNAEGSVTFVDTGSVSLVLGSPLTAPTGNTQLILQSWENSPATTAGTGLGYAISLASYAGVINAQWLYSGQILVGSGTAALPGMSFEASDSTGWRYFVDVESAAIGLSLGAEGDVLHINASQVMYPVNDSAFNLGSTTARWGDVYSNGFSASGTAGASAASSYVGATSSGSPASGTFALGNFTIDQSGAIWICTTAGTVGSGCEFSRADSYALTQIPVPADGYGITGNTGLAPTPAVDLTFASGSLGSDVNMAVSSTTKIMDSASLGVGTWLVRFGGYMDINNTATVEIEMAVDTGTATLSGQQSTELQTSSSDATIPYSIESIVTVTAAATVKLQGHNNSGTVVPVAKASTSATGDFPNATGYTAIRIA